MKTTFVLLTFFTSLICGFTDHVFGSKQKPEDITADLYAKVDMVELQLNGVKQAAKNIEMQEGVDILEARFLHLQSEIMQQTEVQAKHNSIGLKEQIQSNGNFIGSTQNIKAQSKIFN